MLKSWAYIRDCSVRLVSLSRIAGLFVRKALHRSTGSARAAWRSKVIRYGVYAVFCTTLFLYLFVPGLLFGAGYREARERLEQEISAAKQCPLSLEGEGIRSFVFALVSLEDRQFLSRPAWLPFNFRGMARAVVKNLVSFRIVQGGSSIQMQVVKLVSGGAGRKRSLFSKLMEMRLAFNFIGASHLDILTAYSRLVDTGMDGEHGLVSASLNFYSKFPEEMTPEEGAAIAGIQNAPSLLRHDLERLNARVKAGVDWLNGQGIFLPFAKSDTYVEPFRYDYSFRGFQPPSLCYADDREAWTYQKLLAETIGAMMPEAVDNAALASGDEKLSVGLIAVSASEPYKVVTRYGKWTERVPIPVGSVLKPLLLELYVRWLGPERLKSVQAPVGEDVFDLSLKPYGPRDEKPVAADSVSIPQAVARSINSASVSALVLLPYHLYLHSPKKFEEFASVLTEKEVTQFSVRPDRALGARILSDILKREIDPDGIPRALSYRAAQLAALRRYKLLVKAFTGQEISEYLSSVLGAEIRMSPHDIATTYAWLFFPQGNCALSWTAELLSREGHEGTLRTTFARIGLSLPGKTGTTDHSAIAVIGACVSLDGTRRNTVPMVTVIAATDHMGKPFDLQGSSLGVLFTDTTKEISNFGYSITPPR